MSTSTSISTGTLRVRNHNNWPVTELFPCEREFKERLARHNIQQIFVTAALVPNDADEAFNSAVGHILDGLESLPMRPDAAFDSLYRVIDPNLAVFEESGSSLMCATVDAFFDAHPTEWTAIVELLAYHCPQQTADYAASRILDCHVESDPPHTDRMKKRASRSLGPARYEEFCKKYLFVNQQNANLVELHLAKRMKAGQLMRKLLRDGAGLAGTGAGTPAAAGPAILDLGIQGNLLLPREKLLCLMEICLATYRHERFHGKTFSPFRSSKASLKTYAHAYYLLMVAYVIVLGMLEHREKGGITMAGILEVAQQSMHRFSSFFGELLDE